MRRLSGVGIVLLVLLSACSGGKAGVNVKSVVSNLVYGVPKKVASAAPSNFETPTEPVQVLVRGGTFNSQGQFDNFRTPPAPPCPKAPADRFPKKPSQSLIEGRPLPGNYEWRVNGHEKTNLFGNVKLFPTTQQTIENVQTTTAPNFQFTVHERDLHYGSRALTNTTYEARADGIYLTKIVSDVAGNSGTFTPTPAINIFPLPAGIGNKIESTGIDPSTLEALRITGGVPRRQRVDACGEPLDSFLADTTETFVHGDGSSESRSYQFGVATQLGGMMIYEKVDTPCNSKDSNGNCTPAPTLSFEAHTGQVTPSQPKT